MSQWVNNNQGVWEALVAGRCVMCLFHHSPASCGPAAFNFPSSVFRLLSSVRMSRRNRSARRFEWDHYSSVPFSVDGLNLNVCWWSGTKGEWLERECVHVTVPLDFQIVLFLKIDLKRKHDGLFITSWELILSRRWTMDHLAVLLWRVRVVGNSFHHSSQLIQVDKDLQRNSSQRKCM